MNNREEMAYQLFKRMQWRGVIATRDDFVRERWKELSDETTCGPCNVDCYCEHEFFGKNYYRDLAEVALAR